MSTPVNARRCEIMLVQPYTQIALDLLSLLSGGPATAQEPGWRVYAPHLDAAVDVTPAELLALSAIDEHAAMPVAALRAAHGEHVVAALLDKQLLIGDHEAHAESRAREQRLRAQHWHPLTAVSHGFSRWHDVGIGEDVLQTRNRTMQQLIDAHGLPPPHVREHCTPAARLALPRPAGTPLSELLRRRTTCRNFDREAELDVAQLSFVLDRAVAAHAEVEFTAQTKVLKKSNPSGGSLHPIECYLLLRRVGATPSGLYHYHPVDHALEPLQALDEAQADALAERLLAGQTFLADAQALLFLVARFGRTYWKYRRHPKAYRVVLLEAGHVSQNIYLAATEAGLGAWITAAINEVEIEQAFGLDPAAEGPLAACGIGVRSAVRSTLEFDPLHAVWPPAADDPPVHRCRPDD